MQFHQSDRQVAITPTDGAGAQFSPCESLWIGVGGTITYTPADPTLPYGTATPVATTVPVGVFPVKACRVAATGTTATGILAFY